MAFAVRPAPCSPFLGYFWLLACSLALWSRSEPGIRMKWPVPQYKYTAYKPRGGNIFNALYKKRLCLFFSFLCMQLPFASHRLTGHTHLNISTKQKSTERRPCVSALYLFAKSRVMYRSLNHGCGSTCSMRLSIMNRCSKGMGNGSS